MKIGAINNGLEAIGSKFKTSKTLKKVGNFCDPKGKQVSTSVFTALILSCVLFPRMFNARDKTERREIFTRDAVSISTMLFAMKGISGAFAKGMEKKLGLVLTNKVVDKNLNPLQKFWEFIKPNGGVNILSDDGIIKKCSDIKDEKTLGEFLNYIDNNGGDVKKVLKMIEKSGGEGLNDLCKNVIGEGEKTTKNIIENVVNSNFAEKIIKTLDNTATNPIIKNSKMVNSILKTATLGVIVSILGIGLPKFNEFLTKKLDKKEGGQGDVRDEYKRENIFIKTSLMNTPEIYANFKGLGVK